MSNVETRQVNRDSLFLLAQIRVEGRDAVHRIKVRNLSAGGMMAEGDVKVTRGERVAVELRNIGSVEGTVAWKQDDRFGIAFIDEIDPREARAPAKQGEAAGFEQPRYTRTYSATPTLHEPDPDRLRKI